MTTPDEAQALLPVTPDIDAAAKIIDPDAWHQTLPTDGCGVYWMSRRSKARSQAEEVLALYKADNKAGGLWYRRWHEAQTRVNELERSQSHSLPGDVGKERLSQIIAKARDDWHDAPLGSMPDYIADQIRAALTPSPCPGDGMREAALAAMDKEIACYTGHRRSDDDIRYALNSAKTAVRAALTPLALSGEGEADRG